MSNAPISRSTFEFSFPFHPPKRTPAHYAFYANQKQNKFRFDGHPAELILERSGQENLTPGELAGPNPILVGGTLYLISGTWALPGTDRYRILHDGDPVTDWLPSSQDIGGGMTLRNHLVEYNALGKTITAEVRRSGAAPVPLAGSRFIEPAIEYQIIGASAQVHDGSPFVPAMPAGAAPGDLALVFMVSDGMGGMSRDGGISGWMQVASGIGASVDSTYRDTRWLYLPDPATFGTWNHVSAWACLVLRPSRKPAAWSGQPLGWFGQARHAQRADAAETAWANLPIMRAAYSRAICFYRRLADEPVALRPDLWSLAEAGAEVRVWVAMSPTEVTNWGASVTPQALSGGSDTLAVELRAYGTALYD